MSAGCATTGRESVTVSWSGVARRRPPSRMASWCSPRATSTTSCPCCASRPPTTPPIAPAPYTTKRMTAQPRAFPETSARREHEAGDGPSAVAWFEHGGPVVQRGDLRDDRQPEARTGERPRAGGAIEAVEHTVAVFSCDAGAAVGHLHRAAVYREGHRGAVGAELQRVVDQVRHGAVEHRPPALDHARGAGVDDDLVTRAPAEPRRHVVGHLAEGHRLHRLPAADIGGEHHHLAHQVRELVELETGLRDELCPLVGVERRGVAEEVDVGADGGERCPQLVARVDDEALLLL